MHNRIRAALGGAVMALFAAPSAQAVPISAPINSEFYSFQLRGISYDPAGETVGVHVYDHTFDGLAFGHLTITDLTTATILYNFTSGDYGDFSTAGTFDSAPFLLPYNHLLSYSFNGQEFSNMSILFGGAIVASGSSFSGDFPSYSTTETIANPAVPEPLTLSFLAAGLVGLGFMRRERKRS